MTPALVLVLPLALALHDGHGPHARPPASAPTLDRPLRVGEGDLAYEAIPGWCRLPDERALGNTHGAIVIDGAGHVYFNTDTQRSIMVYKPDGTFVRSIAGEFPGIHGMVLRQEEGDGEVIYAAHLQGQQILKLKTDGTLLWKLPVPMESGKYDDDPGAFHPTAVAVAPGGDIFVADGYGRNWIHQFTKERAWVRSFGGPGSGPGSFRTCHGLSIDVRGEQPCLIVCDRENRRLQRFDLTGRFMDVPEADLRRPCSLAFHGQYTAVAELEGRVTILDRNFKPVAHLGDNPRTEQWANNGVKLEDWVSGVFTAPHAVCFDAGGDLYVMDWNATGRISKLARRPAAAPLPPP